jgi:hypothetical protein
MQSVSSRCEYCQKPSDTIFHGCRMNMFLWSSANIRYCKSGGSRIPHRHLFVHTLVSSLFRNPERDSVLSRVSLQCFSLLPMTCLQIYQLTDLRVRRTKPQTSPSHGGHTLKHPHLLYEHVLCATSNVEVTQRSFKNEREPACA